MHISQTFPPPFKLYEKIKEYFSSHSSHSTYSKNLFQIRISKQDIYDIESSNYSSEITISGIITDDTLNTLNDNDVFEKIYSFLEFLFVELHLCSLPFLFRGFNEYKRYHILPNLKKK